MQAARMGPLLGCLAALALAAPAWGQDAATAEALFRKGLEDMEAGRYGTGCPALAESHRLDPRPGTLFTLAECEAKGGLVASAVAHYGDYLALFARMPGDQRLRQQGRDVMAQAQIEKLAPLVPHLIVVLPPNAPRGTVVRRDGVAMGAPSLGIPLPVNPGDHELATQAPGGSLTVTKVTLAQGDRIRVELKVATPPAAAAEPPPATQPSSQAPLPPARSPSQDRGSTTSTGSRQVWTYVLGGLAVEGLAVGAASGLLAWDKKRVIERECEGSACSEAGLSAADSARTYGLLSTVSFAVGLASLTGAAVLWATEPSDSTDQARALTPVVAADGATGGYVGMRGRF